MVLMKSLAAVFLLGFDSVPILADKSLYDLALKAGAQERLAGWLADTDSTAIVCQLQKEEAPDDVEPAEWQAWRALFQMYLNAYGHAIYNLDFANPVPADDPTARARPTTDRTGRCARRCRRHQPGPDG